jgi:hypothetical protein
VILENLIKQSLISEIEKAVDDKNTDKLTWGLEIYKILKFNDHPLDK